MWQGEGEREGERGKGEWGERGRERKSRELFTEALCRGRPRLFSPDAGQAENGPIHTPNSPVGGEPSSDLQKHEHRQRQGAPWTEWTTTRTRTGFPLLTDPPSYMQTHKLVSLKVRCSLGCGCASEGRTHLPPGGSTSPSHAPRRSDVLTTTRVPAGGERRQASTRDTGICAYGGACQGTTVTIKTLADTHWQRHPPAQSQLTGTAQSVKLRHKSTGMEPQARLHWNAGYGGGVWVS